MNYNFEVNAEMQADMNDPSNEYAALEEAAELITQEYIDSGDDELTATAKVTAMSNNDIRNWLLDNKEEFF